MDEFPIPPTVQFKTPQPVEFLTPQDTNVVNVARNYLDEVSKNNVAGSSALVQVGNTPVVTNLTLDVWSFGASVLAYTPPVSATIDTISSASLLDVGIPMLINGLDADHLEVQVVAVLNGQTKVVLSTPLLRINSAANISGTPTATVATPLSGDVFIYEDTAITSGVPIDPNKVKEHVPVGFENSKHALITIPAGKSFNIKKFLASLTKKGSGAAIFTVYRQAFGGVAYLIDKFDVNSDGTTSLDVDIPLPFNLTATEDVWFTAEISGNAISASIIFNGELYTN